MSELPPTGPRDDVYSAPDEAEAEAGAARRDFDTTDTQELPIAAKGSTETGFGDAGAEESGGSLSGASEADALGGEPPGSAEGLRALVLARVRETREELLRLIDRFLEQQDRRVRAAEEERQRIEQENRAAREREEAERRRLEVLAADTAAASETQRARDAERIAELEQVLALQAGMPDQVAALQTDVVSRLAEIAILEAKAQELESAKARVETLEAQLAAAERRGPRSSPMLASLRRAVFRLDEAPSQTEVLSRLLEEATGFASRSALFLVRRSQPLGQVKLAAWGACGFADQGGDGLEVVPPSEWQGALEGRTLRGGAELGGAVAQATDSASPLDALIVPFILRDETRALLYVDRFDGDHPFDADALQLLCFVAAHALEVLPLRHQRPAGTLADPEWTADSAAGAPEEGAADLAEVDASTTAPTPIPLSAFTEAVEAPLEAPESERPESEPELVAEPAAEPVAEAAEPAASEEAASVAPSPPPIDSEKPSAPVTAEVTEEDLAAARFGRERSSYEETSPAPAQPELAALDTVDLGGSFEPIAPRPEATTQQVDMRSLDLRDPASVERPSDPAPRPEPPTPAPPPNVFSPSFFAPSEEPVVTPGRAALDALLRASAQPPAPPAPVSPWQPATPAAPQPPPQVAAPQPPPPAPTPPAPPPVELKPPTPPTFGREVTPPTDIDGPGWAFSSSRRAAAGDEQHAHEEAKRLARLLVSELQLYNEEEIDEGRRQGNVYRFLKEHIDKSRMLYEERVDESIRRTTDYFRDELVKTLAGGDPARLGF